MVYGKAWTPGLDRDKTPVRLAFPRNLRVGEEKCLGRVLHVPEPGQLVDVRRRRYVVVDITQSSLPTDMLSPTHAHAQHLVTLSSVEDDALGEDLQVIWEIEPGATAIERMPVPQPVGFDTPQRLDMFLNKEITPKFTHNKSRIIKNPYHHFNLIELKDLFVQAARARTLTAILTAKPAIYHERGHSSAENESSEAA